MASLNEIKRKTQIWMRGHHHTGSWSNEGQKLDNLCPGWSKVERFHREGQNLQLKEVQRLKKMMMNSGTHTHPGASGAKFHAKHKHPGASGAKFHAKHKHPGASGAKFHAKHKHPGASGAKLHAKYKIRM